MNKIRECRKRQRTAAGRATRSARRFSIAAWTRYWDGVRNKNESGDFMASDSIEYMCRFCGKKQMSFQSRGRPEPGHCPRNPRKSGGPHSWSVNRRWKAATSSVKSAPSKMIEYMCRFCGQKKMISQSRGRPEPGHCPRKTNGGPHSWVVNRRF